MNEIVKLRLQPEVILIGNREIISTGQFNLGLVADKIIKEGVNDWLTISELAKFVYGKSFLANNRRVRKYIWQLRRELLRRGFLLIAEGYPIEYVKIYVGSSEVEVQLAHGLVKKMHTRTDISAALYETAVRLLQLDRSESA